MAQLKHGVLLVQSVFWTCVQPTLPVRMLCRSNIEALFNFHISILSFLRFILFPENYRVNLCNDFLTSCVYTYGFI